MFGFGKKIEKIEESKTEELKVEESPTEELKVEESPIEESPIEEPKPIYSIVLNIGFKDGRILERWFNGYTDRALAILDMKFVKENLYLDYTEHSIDNPGTFIYIGQRENIEYIDAWVETYTQKSK